MLTRQAHQVGDAIGPDPELPARLRLAITRLARRLRQESGSGLSPSMTSALATIERRGPITPSELAAAERVQRPTATRILAGLDEAGLIRREADPSDGRVNRAHATSDGRALLRRLRTRKNAYLARRLRTLDDEQRATLERAAELIERLLEEER
jgi:DNA-binding MarR family transcriptional regulator